MATTEWTAYKIADGLATAAAAELNLIVPDDVSDETRVYQGQTFTVQDGHGKSWDVVVSPAGHEEDDDG
jgi:hypothetical protein